MKQRWLIEPLPVSDSTLIAELDSHIRVELVTLMAMAIECVQFQQGNLLHHDKEGRIDERIAATSQD